MSGEVANQRLVELTVHEEHGEFYEDGGAFLPLSVWTQQGYNATAIADGALPKDQRDHPYLGKTYRVNIIKAGHRGLKTVGKTDKLLAGGQSSGGASSSGLQALTGPTPQLLALADLDSSDSSSSSSSSRHKRSKKTKKSKKDKKKTKKDKKQNRKRGRSEEKASLSSNCFWGYIIIKRPCR
jgi:hypothetical protein